MFDRVSLDFRSICDRIVIELWSNCDRIVIELLNVAILVQVKTTQFNNYHDSSIAVSGPHRGLWTAVAETLVEVVGVITRTWHH